MGSAQNCTADAVTTQDEGCWYAGATAVCKKGELATSNACVPVCTDGAIATAACTCGTGTTAATAGQKCVTNTLSAQNCTADAVTTQDEGCWYAGAAAADKLCKDNVVSDVPNCSADGVLTAACKCTTGAYCQIGAMYNAGACVPVCGNTDGATANAAACVCTSASCTAGQFCMGGACYDSAKCANDAKLAAVCTCGTTGCKVGEMCSSDACVAVCGNTDGTVMNT